MLKKFIRNPLNAGVISGAGITCMAFAPGETSALVWGISSICWLVYGTVYNWWSADAKATLDNILSYAKDEGSVTIDWDRHNDVPKLTFKERK
jgi:hypothetical protein